VEKRIIRRAGGKNTQTEQKGDDNGPKEICIHKNWEKEADEINHIRRPEASTKRGRENVMKYPFRLTGFGVLERKSSRRGDVEREGFIRGLLRRR
jgi:hypothetical protein